MGQRSSKRVQRGMHMLALMQNNLVVEVVDSFIESLLEDELL